MNEPKTEAKEWTASAGIIVTNSGRVQCGPHTATVIARWRNAELATLRVELYDAQVKCAQKSMEVVRLRHEAEADTADAQRFAYIVKNFGPLELADLENCDGDIGLAREWVDEAINKARGQSQAQTEQSEEVHDNADAVAADNAASMSILAQMGPNFRAAFIEGWLAARAKGGE